MKLENLHTIISVVQATRKQPERKRPLPHRIPDDSTKFEIYDTGSEKGFGVRTKCAIPKNTLLFEYQGDVISSDEANKKRKIYSKQQRGNYLYDFTKIHDGKKDNLCVDATSDKYQDTFGRMCNHAKTKYTAKIEVREIEGKTILVFKSVRDLKPKEEITYVYIHNPSKQELKDFPWLKL